MKSTLNLVVLAALVAVSASFVVQTQQRNAMNCLMCEVAVKVAETPADKETHVLEQDFDNECKSALGSIPFAEKECEKYGNSKFDSVINEIEGGTAPQDVCTKLKEC